MSKPMADTPPRRPRRRFDEEFKAQAVRLVLDEGKSVGSVARDLDLTETALREWVNRARADRTKGKTGLTTAEREELTRLRRENRILQEEREILKNESRALTLPDLWATNSVAYAHTPEAVAVRFLVTS
jgi:transposase